MTNKQRRAREKYRNEHMYRMNMYQMSQLRPSMHMSDIANKEYCYIGNKLYNFDLKKPQTDILEKRIKRYSFKKKLKWFKDSKRVFRKFLDKSRHYSRIHKINRNKYKIDYVPEKLLDIIPGTSIKRFSIPTFLTIHGLTYKTKRRHAQHLLTPEDRKRLSQYKY